MIDSSTSTVSPVINMPHGSYAYRPEQGDPTANLDRPVWIDGTTGGFYADAASYPGNVSHAIMEEAYSENVNRDHETALAMGAPVVVSTMTPGERDALAAQAQAELLGATADQRAKLRQIVTDRQTALARVTELELERDLLRQNLQHAQAGDISADDSRLTSIWVKAAEEADRQGYCSVYDGIASTVGAPTRDELKEQGYLIKSGVAQVRISSFWVSIPVDDVSNWRDDIDNSTINNAITDYLENETPPWTTYN